MNFQNKQWKIDMQSKDKKITSSYPNFNNFKNIYKSKFAYFKPN